MWVSSLGLVGEVLIEVKITFILRNMVVELSFKKDNNNIGHIEFEKVILI